MNKYDKYVKRVMKSGATQVKVIDADTIVTAYWVRLKCQFGCGGYGKRLTCPPYSPTPEYTREVLKEYSKALLIIYRVEPDALDNMEGVIKHAIIDTEREMFLDGYYKAYGLASGPCELCKKCDLTKPCKYPYQTRPSMEASGIDVYRTVRNAGFKIEVVKTYDTQCTLCGLVLIE